MIYCKKDKRLTETKQVILYMQGSKLWNNRKIKKDHPKLSVFAMLVTHKKTVQGRPWV